MTKVVQILLDAITPRVRRPEGWSVFIFRREGEAAPARKPCTLSDAGLRRKMTDLIALARAGAGLLYLVHDETEHGIGGFLHVRVLDHWHTRFPGLLDHVVLNVPDARKVAQVLLGWADSIRGGATGAEAACVRLLVPNRQQAPDDDPPMEGGWK